MNRQKTFLSAISALLLSGCAFLAGPSVSPGETEAQVVARMGKPTGIYQDGRDRLLEYRTNPGGQATWMVRLDEAGRAKGIEQVLSVEKFASIKLHQDRKEDVLRKVGAPYETSYLSLSQQEVWSYMYLENGAWDSLMHIHFDRSGTVSMMMNAPDLWRRPLAGGHGG